MNRIFSGIQPTGNLHLGNYLGAIRNWVDLQGRFECLYCIVDLHAITLWQEPDELRASTREVTAGLIAAGIDPDKNILFNQSQNPDHATLAWIFNCVARLGWLNRMTQFKEKAGKHRENASVGLYAYPNLMAADILAYKATHVPVGDDQKQHLELTRDIAQKFNNDFKVDLFPMPEPMIFGEATRVMSLRDGNSKMSKSDPSEYSRINLTDGPDDIALKIRRAKTDPEPLPREAAGLEARPEADNLVGIYAALARKSRGRGAGRGRRHAILPIQAGADRPRRIRAGAHRPGDAALGQGPRLYRRRSSTKGESGRGRFPVRSSRKSMTGLASFSHKRL